MELIHQRLREYKPASREEELNVCKEIYQEIALAALARAGFFQKGAFQGGTCLRIIHHLDRFSEDLDFVLKEPNPNFTWSPYLHAMEDEFKAHGLQLTAIERSRASTAVKKAFLKDDSFGQILTLQYPRNRSDTQTIKIKLEIDINPPRHSEYTTHVTNYPFPFSVVAQALPSLFAGKCIALLCRQYIKGRDWYDFLWYLRSGVSVNYPHLHSGLVQHKQNEKFHPELPSDLDRKWLVQALTHQICIIDWNKAKIDVKRFLRHDRQHVIQEWSRDLFLGLLPSLQQ